MSNGALIWLLQQLQIIYVHMDMKLISVTGSSLVLCSYFIMVTSSENGSLVFIKIYCEMFISFIFITHYNK